MSHPPRFEADYVESRSRLTTFLRPVLVIPHLVAASLYAVAATLAVIVAWFALVLTGRYPQGLYDFVAGFLRYLTRVYGYLHLLCDPYPPFSGSPETVYPVQLRIGPPRALYSRPKALFRIVLAIPPAVIASAMQVVAQVGAVLAWLAILALGRQPRGLQDMIVLGLSYQQRTYAYLALVSEDWPAVVEEATADRLEPAGGPPALSSDVDAPVPAPEDASPPHGDPMR